MTTQGIQPPESGLNKPIIGLIGGIGSGKSTVASILTDLGAVVLDADHYAKELLLDSDVRIEIKKTFGDAVFDSEGTINRERLADRVFTHESDRAKINAIIHPRVRARFKELIKTQNSDSPGKIIVLDVPLLLGSELKSLCNLILMVRSPLKSRIARVQKERQWDAKELTRREGFQHSCAQKEAAADVFIENNGTIKELKREVEAFFNDYIRVFKTE